jgi:uncharacterized protein YqgV (UPF0045/DUF77 family)
LCDAEFVDSTSVAEQCANVRRILREQRADPVPNSLTGTALEVDSGTVRKHIKKIREPVSFSAMIGGMVQ